MRRMVLLSLIAILVTDACAQRRGGMGAGFMRGGGTGFREQGIGNRGYVIPYGYGYGGYGYGYSPYAGGGGYAYAPQPMLLVLPQMQPEPVEAPPPEVHPVVIDYKRTEAGPATSADGEAQSFGIVLKDGETLNATTVVAEGDALHYVDPDERNMRIALSAVDREATRKLNAERKLVLHLPALPPMR